MRSPTNFSLSTSSLSTLTTNQRLSDFSIIITTATPGSVTINPNVGVCVEARLVKVHKLRAFRLAQFSVFDALRHLSPKSIVKQSALVTRAARGLANRRSANYFLDEVAFFIDVNLRLIGRTEQIVIVAHHFLVSADQHKGEIIRLARK